MKPVIVLAALLLAACQADSGSALNSNSSLAPGGFTDRSMTAAEFANAYCNDNLATQSEADRQECISYWTENYDVLREP